jgi:glycosyltransferase involved in cell wall biosynthesis
MLVVKFIENRKTSVVVTTYNDGEFLKRSLPSIINQSQKPLEIIIVDDGSDNNLAETLANTFIGYSDIPIIYEKKENGGPSSARNLGIKIAKGEYILFLDSDDELLGESLEWRQKTLDSLGKNYASVYCSSINCFKNNKKIIDEVNETNGEIDGCLVGRKKGVPGGSPNHFFRKKILMESNGYHESLKFNEDFELILRISKKWAFLGVNRPGFIRHIRNNSWSNKDPYISYNGVESFLDIAFKNELLPFIEINKRRKENRLTLIKNFLVQGRKFKEIIPYIDEAFDIMYPQNIREFLLHTLNRMIKTIYGLK